MIHKQVQKSSDRNSESERTQSRTKPSVQPKPSIAQLGQHQSVPPANRFQFNLLAGVQAKLTIGQPNDQYEQEADRVAAQVVNQLHAPTTQHSTQPQAIQREAIPEDEELQMKPEIQCRSNNGGAISQELETAIQQTRGSGQPLAENIRVSMEQSLGADFSGVKVHTDAQADQLNRSIQAKAFTTGQDVFFRQGEYNPRGHEGQELIAHELTHVVQQGGKAMLQRRDYNPNPVPAAKIALTAHHVIPHSCLENYEANDIAKEFIPSKDKVTLEQLVNIHLLPKLDDSRSWGENYSEHGAMTAKEFLSDTKIRNSSQDKNKDYQKVLTAINKVDEAKTGKKRSTDLNKSEKEEITGSFFLWSPANIFTGPSPQLRDWDPGSAGLDTDAQYFLAPDQYTLLNQTYNLMQAQDEDKKILKNFSSLATNYNKVTPYDSQKWQQIKPSNKYCPAGRKPRA